MNTHTESAQERQARRRDERRAREEARKVSREARNKRQEEAVVAIKSMAAPPPGAKLRDCSNVALLRELVRRNQLAPAPTQVTRSGYSEIRVGVGPDYTVYVTFPDEAVEVLTNDLS